MPIKIEKIGSALVVTNTDTNKILISAPTAKTWYDEDFLEKNNIIKFYDMYSINDIDIENDYYKEFNIDDCVDSSLTSFTKSSFRSFSFNNLGKSNAVPTALLNGEFIFVSNLNDLPSPINSIINLEANKTYYFVNDIDLLGGRLVANANTVILGASSENSSITSTGLSPTEFLLYTNYTMPVRHITFKNVNKAIGINPDNLALDIIAIDWYGVNFSGCVVNIECGDVDNFIFKVGAVLGSGTIIFKGIIGTIGISDSLFTGDGTSYNIFDLKNTSEITRRFRITYSSFVAFGSTVGINVDIAATLPVEGYILDTVNFAGGGTYLSGLDHTVNESLFSGNRGINNSDDISQYYMNNNIINTTVVAVETPYKVSGNTLNSDVTQKFINTTNRSTYVGALNRYFKVTATLSVSSGNNNEIGVYIAKNGSILTDSEIYSTTNAGGRSENIVVQSLILLTTNDYIEIFVENNTAISNILVTDLNVIIQ